MFLTYIYFIVISDGKYRGIRYTQIIIKKVMPEGIANGYIGGEMQGGR